MKFIFMLLSIVILLWLMLVLAMLPVFLIKKRTRPDDEKNTLKSLIVKSLLASVIFGLIFCSGFIAIYTDELKGVYRF